MANALLLVAVVRIIGVETVPMFGFGAAGCIGSELTFGDEFIFTIR